MNKKTAKIFIILTALLLSACSGMRQSGDSFTLHAESLNLIGFRIPGDDHQRAQQALPKGAEVHTVISSPSDWTSVLGVINRIIGVSITEISGEIKK